MEVEEPSFLIIFAGNKRSYLIAFRAGNYARGMHARFLFPISAGSIQIQLKIFGSSERSIHQRKIFRYLNYFNSRTFVTIFFMNIHRGKVKSALQFYECTLLAPDEWTLRIDTILSLSYCPRSTSRKGKTPSAISQNLALCFWFRLGFARGSEGYLATKVYDIVLLERTPPLPRESVKQRVPRVRARIIMVGDT